MFCPTTGHVMESDFEWARLRPNTVRRNIRVMIGVGVTLALTIGGLGFAGQRNLDAASAASEHASATNLVSVQLTAASTAIAASTAKLADAQALFDGSAGQVATESSRDAVAAEITRLTADLNAAKVEVQEAELAVAVPVLADSFWAPNVHLQKSTKHLSEQGFSASIRVAADIKSLGTPVFDLTVATVAWHSEQSRLAAEAKAAADSAAAAAASRSAARSASVKQTAAPQLIAVTPGPSAPAHEAAPSGPFTLNVWASGGQAEVDACKGGVDATGVYFVAVIAEHWGCGGYVFPQAAGTVITITGLDAGQYKVLGVVATLDHSTAHTIDIPGGYDLLYQTCQNNNDKTMTFTALQKIG